MNPRFRIYAALAAALLVIVAAGAIMGVGSNIAPQTTPSPAATPIATSGGPLPPALQGRWMSGTRPALSPSVDIASGTSLVITATTIAVTPSNEGDRHLLASLALELGDGNLRLELDGTRDGCTDGDLGAYTWSLTSLVRILHIEPQEDACSKRMGSITGDWWKMDCPIEDNFCLGPLQTGEYASQFFDPFVSADETWKPRFAALEYAVPGAWSNSADWPDNFNLVPTDATDGAGINLFSGIVALSEEDNCGETRARDVGETAEELAVWLNDLPGLVASTPSHLQVSGLDAWRLDISVDPAWTTTCPFSGGKAYRGFFTDTSSEPGFAWGLIEGSGMRLYLVDLGDGRALMISIQADLQGTLDEFIEDATTIVESVQLTP